MPSLSRRALLRGAAASAVAVPLGVGALTACSREPSHEEVLAGQMAPLASAATASAGAARRLATTQQRQSAALDRIATIRDQHAVLLREEILRLHPASESLITTPSESASPSGSPSGPTTGPVSDGSLDAFRKTLADDAAAARTVAIGASGFQAGLTASISASVASLTGLLS
ncbi:MAG TPA: hypothetical protein PK331_16445 [Gordonia sp. (in: high G+C Gram-positive bacteria)]|uniref:hypothetical protein n=1 Tax=Gordonia sp. (in: high G+C Gram-positive bacteria) TaxID=84139 RepID=UPI000FBC782C|nr:hypothetical protein [Gordonia sp. (in: high G+C Gram-positive bacteria)]RTL08879.1 MAG: hypothetical protein EKK62_05150 [Acidimicrobiia bacterium]HRC52499.1 hypothetical protein [Gordonia sp. (in: high G+C Gram-positive bacteria)]